MLFSDKPSSNYIPIARKYRPASFSDIVGQELIVETLKNEIRTMRIPQAILFTGIRGVGKTTMARIMAKAMNCAGVAMPSVEFCNKCEQCKSIAVSSNQDVPEIDAASHTGVDDIRTIIESGKYKPVLGRFKVYIIDEVHMLSNSAFNALLKTLEEPPAHLKFIFATTEIRKIPQTILSRCQRFNLHRVSVDLLRKHYTHIVEKEQYAIEDGALDAIVTAADGSIRDGMSILDQAIALAVNNSITTESVLDMLGIRHRDKSLLLFDAILTYDMHNVSELLYGMYTSGVDVSVLMHDVLYVIYSLLRALSFSATKDTTLGDDSVCLEHTHYTQGYVPFHKLDSQEFAKRIEIWSTSMTKDLLLAMWSAVIEGLEEMNFAVQQWLIVEVTTIKLMHIIFSKASNKIDGGYSVQPNKVETVGGNTESHALDVIGDSPNTTNPVNIANLAEPSKDSKNMDAKKRHIVDNTENKEVKHQADIYPTNARTIAKNDLEANHHLQKEEGYNAGCVTCNKKQVHDGGGGNIVTATRSLPFLSDNLLVQPNEVYEAAMSLARFSLDNGELMLYHWLLHDVYVHSIKLGYVELKYGEEVDGRKLQTELKERLEHVTKVTWCVAAHSGTTNLRDSTLAELEELQIEQRKRALVGRDFIKDTISSIDGLIVDKVKLS